MSITSQILGSRGFWETSKVKSAIAPLFSDLEVLSFSSDIAKLFSENLFKNSNLDESGVSVPIFSSRTNLKLHNISVTPRMVKKVVTNVDSLKTSLVVIVFQWWY